MKLKRGLVGVALIAAIFLGAVHFSLGQSSPTEPPLPPGFSDWLELFGSPGSSGGATTSTISPPGEGGSGEGGENPPPSAPYSIAGLNVSIPVLTNNQFYLTIFDNSTNGNTFTNLNYDIYGRTKFNFHYRWHELITGSAGQTNFYVPNPSPSNMFYVALLGTDSDGDLLTDGFEAFVSHTLGNTNDTDGDGISDFEEWRIGANPTNSAGIVADTNGLVRLRTHTRLK